MWEWLLSPIDASRAHDVSFALAWHGRVMVLGWAVLAPLAVVVARFFKILPGQDWPRELDNQLWWHSHWIGQTLVTFLSLVGFALVLPSDLSELGWHARLGYLLLALLLVQVLLGVFRGSKGGPTAPGRDGTTRGHHYDMSRWRRTFEALHKSIGYSVLALAAVTILFGLWHANAPLWMWLLIILWWVGLIWLFRSLQVRGLAVDTYQAIWGDDPAHPGNRQPAPGWGVRRPSETNEGERNVRIDRGDGLRSHRPEL